MKDFNLLQDMCGLNEKQLELDESELERKFKSIIRDAQRVADSSDKNHKMYEDDCINLANHLTELASDIKQHNLMTRQLKVFNEYKEHLNKWGV